MPKAIATPTTPGAAASASTRRRVLGGAILAALTGGAFGAAIVFPNPGEAVPAATSPDAELIRLCAECDALQAKADALWTGNRTQVMTVAQSQAFEAAREVDQQPFLDAQDPLLECIVALRATTRQGQVARVQTLLGWDKDPIWTHDGCWNSQLIGAIVRDLVGAA